MRIISKKHYLPSECYFIFRLYASLLARTRDNASTRRLTMCVYREGLN